MQRLRRSTLVLFTAALAFLAVGLWQAALADPDQWRRGGFTTDFSKTAVGLDEILSGGPPKDGIPSIDSPKFEPARGVDWLDGKEAVIRLELDGKVRAYPLRILIWHEIVNDKLGDTPVAVTYCPLCNSSIVFSRTLKDRVLDFGTTGLLRNSDLVMYDRQTETWWQQFTGEAIVGELTGESLKMIPSRVQSFGQFVADHPDAEVLSIPVPAQRAYGRNPYVGYDSRSAPYPLFRGELPENVNPMARVIVVKTGTGPQAVLLSHLRERKRVALPGPIELSWDEGQASALDAATVQGGRDVGNVTAIRTTGATSEDVVHDVTFAFVVHAFHPDLGIIGVD
jgi:hypothetical protein